MHVQNIKPTNGNGHNNATTPKNPPGIWITAVAYRGNIDHIRVHPTEALARWDLLEYLKSYHNYDGPHDYQAADRWVNQRHDVFSVAIEQHPMPVLATAGNSVAYIDQFLRQRGFIVQAHSHQTVPKEGRFEAWAYKGPLNFDEAEPVRFGVGADPIAALYALESHLAILDDSDPA